MNKNKVKVHWIYKIECSENNFRYIGCSGGKKYRITTHFALLQRGTHTNKQLQEDYNKYGPDAFNWTKLDETTAKGRMFFEKYYIWYYGVQGSLYNKNNKCKPRDIELFENIPLSTLKILFEADYLKV